MLSQKQAIKQFREIEKLQGGMRLAAEGWDAPFMTLVATILSARTLDETTIRVCEILFKKYPTAALLGQASEKDVSEIIRPINFYKNKTRYIIACARALDKTYGGKVPCNFETLIALPGVGSKTANVFLSEQGIDAIGIDTHVYYISRYLGWSSATKPSGVEADLKKLFPKAYWIALNPTLVKFGKRYTSRKEKNRLLATIKQI